MNLELIRKKLEQINEQSANRQDNSQFRWVPADGKNQVRVVPSVENPDNPFTELFFYNKLSKFPILALTNFGEQDPVEEFIETLRSTDDKDNWSLSGKISARPRYFVPVIVRGEEDKGVRIWSISATVYKALLSLAADEEVGDFTDIVNGRDLIVEKTPPTTAGGFADIAVRVKLKSTPLSENKEEVKKWLKEQPKPLELFQKPTYDWLKKQLKSYISGAPVVETTEESAEKPAEKPAKEEAAPEKETPKAEFKMKEEKPAKAAPKKSVTTKFDELFDGDEDKQNGNGEEADKLPWEK